MTQSSCEISVLIAGSPECGKTDFIRSMLAGLKATRGDEASYSLQTRRYNITLRVLENDLLRFQQSSLPACIILAYDSSNVESLAVVRQYWHRQVLLSKPSEVDSIPTMLLGLKRDLRGSLPASGVDTQAAIREGQEMRVTHFGECSAKTGQFMKPVAEDFLAMLKLCVAQHQEAFSYCVVS